MVGVLVRRGIPRPVPPSRPRLRAARGRVRARASAAGPRAAARPVLRDRPPLDPVLRGRRAAGRPRLLRPPARPRPPPRPAHAARARRHAGAALPRRRLPGRGQFLHELRLLPHRGREHRRRHGDRAGPAAGRGVPLRHVRPCPRPRPPRPRGAPRLRRQGVPHSPLLRRADLPHREGDRGAARRIVRDLPRERPGVRAGRARRAPRDSGPARRVGVGRLRRVARRPRLAAPDRPRPQAGEAVVIPYAKYPGLSPLFHEFLAGGSDFYPDRPTPAACVERGKQLLAAGRRTRVPASAFRCRGAEASRLAEDLAAGRAVAVAAGHQVGLFTGPVFTLLKALDAIHLARDLTRQGVPAVAVFWALTDDHDLQEIARTARPTPEGPQEIVLEGADRQNRQPVGRLPIPDGVRGVVEAFRPDARGAEAAAVLDATAARSAPGTTYGDAFVETLLDLVAPDPLLVLDPLDPALRPPTVALFLDAALREQALRAALVRTEEKLRGSGRPVPAPVPDGFSFFAIDAEGRRRVEDVPAAVQRVQAGE